MRTLLNIFWHGLGYACLTHEKKHYHGEQTVLSFSLKPKLLRATGYTPWVYIRHSPFPPLVFVDLLLRMLTFHLTPCPYSFLCPVTCLQCLIFFLHLLRMLLMAAISRDGAFLGEIHLLSALAGKLVMRTKGIFI